MIIRYMGAPRSKTCLSQSDQVQMGFPQATHFGHAPYQAYPCHMSKIVLSFLLPRLLHRIAERSGQCQ